LHPRLEAARVDANAAAPVLLLALDARIERDDRGEGLALGTVLAHVADIEEQTVLRIDGRELDAPPDAVVLVLLLLLRNRIVALPFDAARDEFLLVPMLVILVKDR